MGRTLWSDRDGLFVFGAGVLATCDENAVLALSSGFMTYKDNAHPAYRGIRREIVASRSTVILVPSFDAEICVAETVRRQLSRPFSRSAEGEEHVIRARFSVFIDMPAKKFETMRPVEAVVDDLVGRLQPSLPRAASSSRVSCRIRVLASLAEGAATAEILADFPTLTEDDVRAAMAFAATSAQEDLPLAESPVKR